MTSPNLSSESAVVAVVMLTVIRNATQWTEKHFSEDRVANRSFSLQVLTRITLDSHRWLSIESSVKHPVDENGGKIECLPAV